MMRWPPEVLIEVWFPLFAREHERFDVAGDDSDLDFRGRSGDDGDDGVTGAPRARDRGLAPRWSGRHAIGGCSGAPGAAAGGGAAAGAGVGAAGSSSPVSGFTSAIARRERKYCPTPVQSGLEPGREGFDLPQAWPDACSPRASTSFKPGPTPARRGVRLHQPAYKPGSPRPRWSPLASASSPTSARSSPESSVSPREACYVQA